MFQLVRKKVALKRDSFAFGPAVRGFLSFYLYTRKFNEAAAAPPGR
jgi:hypothetical protein